MVRRGYRTAGGVVLLIAFGALLLPSALSGVSSAAALEAAPMHALRNAPHPYAIRAPSRGVAPALYSGHYWAGAYFTGNASTPRNVSTKLTVPDATPSGVEFYYVLLSVWDNSGSYDQIGFANDDGTWGFTYSFTTPCASNYYYDPDYTPLTRGDTYTFTMSLSATGNLTFLAQTGGKTAVHLVEHTGGTSFLDQSFYSCTYGTYYDYTDYEEIYQTQQSMPDFDFFFTGNAQNGSAVTAWSNMGTPPGGGEIQLTSAAVTIANEGFDLTYAAHSPGSVTLAKGTTSYTTHLLVGSFFSSGNVTLQYRPIVQGAFTVSFSPSKGSPGYASTVSITFHSLSAHTPYPLTLAAQNATGVSTYLTLRIVVK